MLLLPYRILRKKENLCKIHLEFHNITVNAASRRKFKEMALLDMCSMCVHVFVERRGCRPTPSLDIKVILKAV